MFRYLLTFITLSLLSTGCGQTDKQLKSILDKAEDYLEYFPDSSLMILNKLNIKELSPISQKARYALLKSIALDKNYIDVTDDSLTSIAIEYYSSKSSSEDKMKAYFYNGRICFNSKNYEKAMENYLIAEECVPKCKDLTYVGLLYNSKAMVYNRVYDYVKAFEQIELAASYY